MSEQIIHSINLPTSDSSLRRDFIKRMQRKLAIKQAFYRDGDRHRFASSNLTLPVDFSL
jgi:hypothetical protein